MATPPMITIKLDAKCAECGKKGAADNQLCLRCTTRAIDPSREMKSWQGRAVQNRWKEMRTKFKP